MVVFVRFDSYSLICYNSFSDKFLSIKEMNFLKFREKVKDLPCFETKELRLVLGVYFADTTLLNLNNYKYESI